jgi:repressor of nif and glnA expression
MSFELNQLQVQDKRPVRFTKIIHYEGFSLDPTEIFIKARMTTINKAVATGGGGILANIREIPAICQPKVLEVLGGKSVQIKKFIIRFFSDIKLKKVKDLNKSSKYI